LVANQVRQDFEFSRSQSKILPRTLGCPRYEVEFEILDPKHSLRKDDRAASGQRLDASEQLREGKWLDKMFIAASPQTADPIVDLAECTQDRSRRVDWPPCELQIIDAISRHREMRIPYPINLLTNIPSIDVLCPSFFARCIVTNLYSRTQAGKLTGWRHPAGCDGRRRRPSLPINTALCPIDL
jgi:hypothetical protein